MPHGRKREAEKLLKVLRASGWGVVLEPRMAGKTSLSIVTAVEYSKSVRIAVIYLNLSTAKSFHDLTVRLLGAVSKLRDKNEASMQSSAYSFQQALGVSVSLEDYTGQTNIVSVRASRTP